MTANPEVAENKQLQQAASLSKSLLLNCQRFFHYRLARHGLPYLRRQEPQFWAARQPTRVFQYPQHPGLDVRLFKPEGTERGPVSSSDGWPIIFMIHGGGCAIGDAAMDDEQAHLLSTHYGFCVLGLEYSLAPTARFPVAIHDLAGLIDCALTDTKLIAELHLDTSKVALVGFSAGGNMALSLAQLPGVQNRIHAIVSFYPLVDFVGRFRVGPTKKTPWGKIDPLPSVLPMYGWAYLPVGQDLQDPLLSPWYATRETIPQPVFMISADDCMREEDCMLARKLAGLDLDVKPEDVAIKSWDVNNVRYEFVPDMPHCFLHFWEKVRDNDKWEQKRLQTNERIWSEVVAWLKSKVEV